MNNPNPLFAKFDQVTGAKTPTVSGSVKNSVADEIRALKTPTPTGVNWQKTPEEQAKENTDNVTSIKSNVEGLGTDLSKRASNISDTFSEALKPGLRSPKEALLGGAKIAAETTSGIGDIATHAFKGLTDIISNNPTIQKLASTDGVGKALDYIKNAGEEAGTELAPARAALAKWEQDHPSISSLISSLGKTGLNLSIIAGAPEVKAVTEGLASEAGGLLKSGAEKTLEMAGTGAKKVIDVAGQAGEKMEIAKPIVPKVGPPKPIEALKQTDETMTPTQKREAVDEGRQVITDKKLGGTNVEYKPTPEIERANKLLEGKVSPKDSPDVVTVKIKTEISSRGAEAEKYLEENKVPITNKEHYDMFATARKEAEKYLTDSQLKAYDEQVKMFSKQLPGRGSYDTSTYYKALKDYEENVASRLPRGKDALIDPTGVANANIRAASDVRKIVRDMIGDKNPEFKPKMYDLASLYEAKDLAIQNASKVKPQTFFEKNPKTGKVIKYGTAIGAGAIGVPVIKHMLP